MSERVFEQSKSRRVKKQLCATRSSGGLTGGTSGLVPNGNVNAAGISLGGGLLGGFSGGVTATNYSNPVQLGEFWGFGLNPVDWLLYAARQVCK
jgi:hypothetical protein